MQRLGGGGDAPSLMTAARELREVTCPKVNHFPLTPCWAARPAVTPGAPGAAEADPGGPTR